jgi:hypothetical protein
MFVALPVRISAFNKGDVVEYSLLPPVEWYKPLRKFETLFIGDQTQPSSNVFLLQYPLGTRFQSYFTLERPTFLFKFMKTLSVIYSVCGCCLGLSAHVEHFSCLHIPRSITSKAFLGWLVKESRGFNVPLKSWDMQLTFCTVHVSCWFGYDWMFQLMTRWSAVSR